MDLSAMNKISYGLFVLAARDGEKDNGCIINTVIQVTAAPNRIAFAVNKSNYTHDIIQKTKLFTVSVLDESARFGTFQNFGFQSGRTAEKFAEIEFARGPNGIAYLTRECCAWISGRVFSTVGSGNAYAVYCRCRRLCAAFGISSGYVCVLPCKHQTETACPCRRKKERLYLRNLRLYLRGGCFAAGFYLPGLQAPGFGF